VDDKRNVNHVRPDVIQQSIWAFPDLSYLVVLALAQQRATPRVSCERIRSRDNATHPFVCHGWRQAG
jgi:hypothetical protein